MLTLFEDQIAEGTLVEGAWMEFKPVSASQSKGLVAALFSVEGNVDGGTVTLYVRTSPTGAALQSPVEYELTAAGITPYFFLQWGWEVRGVANDLGSAANFTMRLWP